MSTNDEEIVKALAEVLSPLPSVISHKTFNRHMFLEAFIFRTGTGCSIEKEDVCDYAGITSKEFDSLKEDYIQKGIIHEEPNPFGLSLFKLCDVIIEIIGQKEEAADTLKEKREIKDRRMGERRQTREPQTSTTETRK